MKSRSILPTFLLLVLVCSAVTFGQHEHSQAQSEVPARLFAGLGNLHHPIATTVPEAQRYFDQGLTLDYAFNHEEAARSFKRAAELDPKAPMPLWGVALAVGPNYNADVDPERERQAFEAIQKAKVLAASGPENERAFIDALATRYSNDPHADLKKLAANYAHAMRELSNRYPDDLDAATIYAESMMDLHPWALWNLDGTPAEGTNEILAVLSSVLARDPYHIGANHYYIHAVEASPHPEWGLACAERLAGLVPAGGHLVHMPSHIYARVGDYPGAVKSNQEAAAADLEYIRATGARGVYPAMYYSHNLHFLAYAAAEAGNFREADESSRALVENIRIRAGGMPPEMTDAFINFRMFVLLRFHRWADVLQAPEPVDSTQMARALWHYARGLAFAGTNQIADAQTERESLASALAKIPPDQPYGYNSSRTLLGLAQALLDARIAEAGGDRKAAIQFFENAVSIQDGMQYDEPPDWYYPVRESLGGALLRAGQFAQAEGVFRESLRRNPRNGRSLFGLWQSLKAQNKAPGAAWIESQFREAWNTADTELTIADL
jgi:tetratricopeptide (TPR) repeat protein